MTKFFFALSLFVSIAGIANGNELRDGFARIEANKAEMCWGDLWSSDTERGAKASLNFGPPYITNRNPILCDALTGVRCAPFECFFVGTMFKSDTGEIHWYDAPRESYPPFIHFFGVAR